MEAGFYWRLAPPHWIAIRVERAIYAVKSLVAAAGAFVFTDLIPFSIADVEVSAACEPISARVRLTDEIGRAHV